MDDTQLATCQSVLDSKKPVGDISSKPAVPASNTAVTNPFNHAVHVEITGGTVTGVKVDGVTVGTRTSGSFRVRKGGTIAWVGSGAPTWQWFAA
jgi:hypothetical protein